MTNYLFVTWPGGGNVPPLLRLGSLLLERDHEVTVLAPDSLADRLGAEGLVDVIRDAIRSALADDRLRDAAQEVARSLAGKGTHHAVIELEGLVKPAITHDPQ